MNLPWHIHTIHNVFAAGCGAALPDGRYVHAVALPYQPGPVGRLRAGWWVITGRAHAFIWPKPGDLEDTLTPRRAAASRAALETLSAEVNWLSRFSTGKQKRPDHEIEIKRSDLAVLCQAAADYRAAASRETRAA